MSARNIQLMVSDKDGKWTELNPMTYASNVSMSNGKNVEDSINGIKESVKNIHPDSIKASTIKVSDGKNIESIFNNLNIEMDMVRKSQLGDFIAKDIRGEIFNSDGYWFDSLKNTDKMESHSNITKNGYMLENNSGINAVEWKTTPITFYSDKAEYYQDRKKNDVEVSQNVSSGSNEINVTSTDLSVK